MKMKKETGRKDRSQRMDLDVWSIYYLLIKQYEEYISGHKMYGIAKRISDTLIEEKRLPKYAKIIKNYQNANKISEVISVEKSHAKQFYRHIKDLLFEELKR